MKNLKLKITVVLSVLGLCNTYAQDNFEGVEEDKNVVQSKSYDITGKVVSQSRSYFDNLGKPTQIQSLDVKTKKVWATETIYDAQSRPALNTNSAPIGTGFGFTTKFIQNNRGVAFGRDGRNLDIGTSLSEPAEVSINSHLGAYYSENTEEGYQDVTARPYSRAIYDELNPGKITQVIGGNRIEGTFSNQRRYPQGFSHTMPAAQELYYAYGKNNLIEADYLRLSSNESESRISDVLRFDSVLSPFLVDIIEIDNCEILSSRINMNIRASVALVTGEVYRVELNNEDTYVRILGEFLVSPNRNHPEATFRSNVTTVCNAPVYNSDVSADYFLDSSVNVNPNITKTVAIDAHGEEVVSFAYVDGQVLATARSGEGPKKEIMALIGEQGYVDIHLPKGCEGSLSFIGDHTDYIVYDLRTGVKIDDPTNIASILDSEILSLFPTPLGAGIYRIEAVEKDNLFNYTYIDNSGNIKEAISNPKGVIYDINYYDYSLNYYDDAGNLTSTLPPIGFDNEAYASYNLTGTVNHIKENLKSTYEYNSLGQLLHTSSPDEGDAWFKYRTDGQIRFSQNSKQAASGEFSYTNYDKQARPIESGVAVGVYSSLDADTETFSSTSLAEQHFTMYDVPDSSGLEDLFDTDVTTISTPQIMGAGFEDSTDGTGDARDSWRTPSNFDWSPLGGGVTVPQISSIANVGSRAGQLTNSGDRVLYQEIEVTPGVQYVLSYDVDFDTHLFGETVYGETTVSILKPDTSSYAESLLSKNIIASIKHDNEGSVLRQFERKSLFFEVEEEKSVIIYVTNSNVEVRFDQFKIEVSNQPTNYKNQAFVSGNVSKTLTQNPSTTTTWYSYDIYGRVTWIVQKIDGLDTPKTIDYEYDDVTGAVNKVYYQKGVTGEQFIHRYTYDEDDYSLTMVETSTNDVNFDIHANYEYYEKGELKRTVLAEGLQGIDYVYNLNGALKAINHPSLDPTKDPGGDTNDIFGMHIDYYKGDYRREGVNISTSNAGEDQYNGNIKAIRWNNKATDENLDVEKTYAYNYDRNNWLKSAMYDGNSGSQTETDGDIITKTNENVIQNITASQAIIIKPTSIINSGVTLSLGGGGSTESASDDYAVSNITYDANGNIQSLKRNKNTVDGSNAMDNMIYHYDPAKPNQLNRVQDLAGDADNADDIDTQSANNYKYNAIGQLEYNNAEGIEYIYTASGLVSEIKKENTTLLKFLYNDRDQRVVKESYNPETGNLEHTDVYVRDAAGTPMAIYRDGELLEHTVYGASRLGVYKRADASTAYELTDHLGNVRAVVQKDKVDDATGTDYYPGGMAMPLRNSLSDYRYQYQGQELDKETGKPAFELRLYDPRIMRWLTTDPYGEFQSPYLAMGNNFPVTIDPDGGCTDPPCNQERVQLAEIDITAKKSNSFSTLSQLRDDLHFHINDLQNSLNNAERTKILTESFTNSNAIKGIASSIVGKVIEQKRVKAALDDTAKFDIAVSDFVIRYAAYYDEELGAYVAPSFDEDKNIEFLGDMTTSVNIAILAANTDKRVSIVVQASHKAAQANYYNAKAKLNRAEKLQTFLTNKLNSLQGPTSGTFSGGFGGGRFSGSGAGGSF